MKLSANGLKFIEQREGFRSEAYQDSGGVWTNGYGNTVGVTADTADITEDQAADDLQRNVATAEEIVDDNVMMTLTQNEFDALVSFVFNVGAGREDTDDRTGRDGFVTLRNGNQSHLLQYINNGDFDLAAEEFLKWDKAGGVEVPGLKARREAEKALFLTPDA